MAVKGKDVSHVQTGNYHKNLIQQKVDRFCGGFVTVKYRNNLQEVRFY
jgi:hypothetical protein